MSRPGDSLEGPACCAEGQGLTCEGREPLKCEVRYQGQGGAGVLHSPCSQRLAGQGWQEACMPAHPWETRGRPHGEPVRLSPSSCGSSPLSF